MPSIKKRRLVAVAMPAVKRKHSTVSSVPHIKKKCSSAIAMPSIKKKRLVAVTMPSIKKKYSTVSAMLHIKKKHSTPDVVNIITVEDPPAFRVTPWYNRDEFRMVASSLFSEHVSVRKWALDKIEIWKIRTYPALPVYIDATASLVRAKLQDTVFTKRISYCRIDGLKLMYAQALIRFVNIASETVQNREKVASFRTALKELKIPEWIVDLRHSCTHSKMPSLAKLQCAASAILDFLQHKYWDVECAKLEKPFVPAAKEDNTELEKRIYLSVEDYKYCGCKSVSHANGEKSKNLRKSLKELTNILMEKCTTAFDILIRPKLFLMDAEDMPVLKGEDFLYNRDLNLPLFVLHLWAPMIGIINSFHKIPRFVARLMELHTNLPPFHQKMACAWIWKLIEMVIHDGDGTYDNSDPIFKIYMEKKWMFTWPALVYDCSTNPSKFMLPILTSIVDQVYPPMPLAAKRGLLTVMTSRLIGLNLNKEDVSSSKLDILSNMQECTSEGIETMDGATDPPFKSIWQPCTDERNWSDLPLGIVLGPVSDFIGAPPNVDDATMDQTSDIKDEQSKDAKPTADDQIASASSTNVQVPFTPEADALPEPTYIVTEADLY